MHVNKAEDIDNEKEGNLQNRVSPAKLQVRRSFIRLTTKTRIRVIKRNIAQFILLTWMITHKKKSHERKKEAKWNQNQLN